MTRAAVTVRVQRTVTARVTVETVFKFSARVCHSCDDGPGFLRERATHGFRYRGADGKIVSDRATLVASPHRRRTGA